MLSLWKKLLSDEAGQGLAEYGFILALVSVVVIAALTALGNEVNTLFNNIKSLVSNMNSPATTPTAD